MADVASNFDEIIVIMVNVDSINQEFKSMKNEILLMLTLILTSYDPKNKVLNALIHFLIFINDAFFLHNERVQVIN